MLDKNWVSDEWGGRAVSVQTTAHLFSKKSAFQQIDVYETADCGRMLVLDGFIQLTERDEFAYQEMMAHVPLFAHPNPERVLVVGGGDGGVLREIAKHGCVKEIDICEIDADVIETARKYLSSLSCGYDDPRVNIHVDDGSKFIHERKKYYDVIIVDSTDPFGPGEALFNEQFYRGVREALRENGIVTSQSESLFIHKDTIIKDLLKICRKLFDSYAYAWMMVPTYPAGNIGLCAASMGPNLRDPARRPDAELQSKLSYYNNEIHKAAFMLPQFARDLQDGTF